jgi:hypothetical protein
MSQSIGQTWEQEVFARGQLTACRENLRAFLEARFGTLPEDLLRRIETADDLERLRDCIRQVGRITSLEQLQL